MKKLTLIITLLVMLASCGPAPTPSPTPDLNATMSAYSGTMVAGTLTAQPTNTLIPTNTSLPTETATSLPTETATLDPSAIATLGSAIPGLPTPTVSLVDTSSGNLTGLEPAILHVENLSGEKEIIVFLTGVTVPREVVVNRYGKVTKVPLNIEIYVGSWQYRVEIPGKRFITGTFRQTNTDKTTMKVYLQKVVILGP